MNNINCVLKEKAQCVGCRACANICPNKAITLEEDEEGFFYPVINNEKCTNCNLCKKACPSLNKSEIYSENTLNPNCYAIMADDETRRVSSSGGAFSLIANKIFEMGGVVCGAAFVGQKVQHIIIDNKNDLYRLRGSKYVQSDTNTVYSQIKSLLKEDKIVLFSGTPCQVAGLNTYLGKKYDKLYTVDLICHGVPPQRVFDKYLEETLQKDDVFYHTAFRDKKAGWGVYLTSTTTTTGKKYTEESLSKDSYLQAFIHNMSLRPSCGSCAYATSQRESDITIGDFWAIERFDKNLNDNKGTSMALLNNAKGKDLFQKISMPVIKGVPLEYASYYNITLKTPLKQHTNRHAFFRLLNEGKSLREVVDYCNKNKYDALILNFWPFKNMGGVLQAWALQNIVRSLGYSNALINYQSSKWENQFNGSFIERFSKKHLIHTEKYNNDRLLNECNDITNTYILGSDCIWGKWDDRLSFRFNYMAKFASPDKKIISYAPSFGNSEFSGSENEFKLSKYYLEQIDHISVRESSGVELLKNTFDIDAVQCLDPTLVLSKDKFDELASKSKYDKTDYIFNYSIGIKEDDEAYEEIINRFKDDNVFSLSQDELDSIDVEDWLYLIKNSKLLITNSYHACCLAIKFNVPFYVFAPYGLDASRFDSLLGMLKLEDRILRNQKDVIKIQNLFEPIDWNNTNLIIEKQKEYSLKWLKAALDKPKDFPKITTQDALIRYLTNSVIELQTSINSCVSIEGMQNVLNYNKNYRKYIKYKILKNFVFGNKRDKYKEQQEIYYEKIKSARRVQRGIASV